MNANNDKSTNIFTGAVIMLVSAAMAVCAQSQTSPARPRQRAVSQTHPKLQALNVKPGLWKTTLTRTKAGELPLPAEMLNRLTPEQRARLEERMRANSGNSNSTTYESCLTKQDLDNPDFTDKRQCTWKTLQSTSTKVKGSASCYYRDSGMKLTGSGEFVAVDQEHVRGTMHMSVTGRGNTMNTNTVFTSKWLKASCGNVK